MNKDGNYGLQVYRYSYHIAQINRENTERRMTKDLKKEVETGKHGTQKYVIKHGENKGKTV